MNVNPGELNKRIEIVQPERVYDSEGYYQETDVSVHSCWAKFSRTSGTEIFQAKADFTEVEARFLIRWVRKEINRKMQVLYSGKRYEIEYVNDYGDEQRYIEIWARLNTKEAEI